MSKKEKETPNERRLREEDELKGLNAWGIYLKHGDIGATKFFDRLRGLDDGYGTSRGAGADYAGNKKSAQIWKTEGATRGEAITDPRVRQAMREAAAEERRESRGMKSGGSVKSYAKGGKIDGCAQRGKTKGRVI